MPDESFADLVAERVVLRRFRLDDLDAFLAYRSSPEVARFQGWDAPFPAAVAERLVRRMMTDQPDTPGEWFQFAVMLRSTGELIGDCAARPDEADGGQAEIGFTMAPGHQGRGYATEAARRLLGYLFGARAKHRVTAYCDARNAASARVLEKLGMRCEGRLRESTWAKGEWTDDLVYAILHREWLAQASPPAQRGHPAAADSPARRVDRGRDD